MSDLFWRDNLIQPSLDNDVDEAVAEQLAILDKDPDNAKAFFALGTLSHFQGRVDDAILYLEKSISLDGDNAAPRLSLGRIYAVRGEYAKAWEQARAAEALGASDLVQMLERYPKLR
jgi:tetratricopeptide (TPR) repeat protein